MAKVWVLDTETKGTGAEMVPLEKAHTGPAPKSATVPPTPRPRPADAPAPREAPRFKVVDVMTRQVLAEGTGTRATVELLEGIRSIVDVGIYLWDEESAGWRPLTLRERRALWDLRGAKRSARGVAQSLP